MRPVAFSAVMGLLAPFVFIIGAERFLLDGCIPVGLYLAVGQFLIARKGATGLRAKLPTLVAMNVPLLAWALVMAVSNRSAVFSDAIPMFLSGCIGSLAGALVAARGPAAERPSIRAGWRTVLRLGAGLLLAVAAILIVLVIPAIARDTSPQVNRSSIVIVLLAFVLFQISAAARILRRTNSAGLPDVAGSFGLVLGLALFGLAYVLEHEPGMRLADIALFACAGGDFLVGGSSLAAALAPFMWLRHSH